MKLNVILHVAGRALTKENLCMRGIFSLLVNLLTKENLRMRGIFSLLVDLLTKENLRMRGIFSLLVDLLTKENLRMPWHLFFTGRWTDEREPTYVMATTFFTG